MNQIILMGRKYIESQNKQTKKTKLNILKCVNSEIGERKDIK